ncbi:MAG: bacillithiol biosynthesis cysteine-adding enzyme BshC [Balneolaceae bacterium]
MKHNSIEFDDLPFSKLFKDYLSKSGTISDYFHTHPFDDEALKKKAKSHSFLSDRKEIVSLLTEFQSDFNAPELTYAQINQLDDPQSLAVVTGQQLTVYGGPLFTVYKTLTAIIYAKKWSEKLDRPIIPVFWLADEDHDYEEVITLGLPKNGTTSSISYAQSLPGKFSPPVGEIQFTEEILSFKKEIKEYLGDTDFHDKLWDDIHQAYGKNQTFKVAFGNWLLHLFGDQGLVLAGSQTKPIKTFSSNIIKQSIIKNDQINKALDDTTYKLISDQYHGQVQVQSSNMFYLDDEKNRTKISVDGKVWSAAEKKWTCDELIAEIDDSPERFSPNVFLRPILQDYLLPTLAYVGGPGEIGYYAQMKSLYQLFGMEMPIIVPRFSMTLIESSVDRVLDKLPFSIAEYNNRIEDLEKSFVKKTEEVDIEKLFGIWKNQMEDLTKAKKNEIHKVDSSLAGSVGKAKAVYFSELDKLKGKVYKSVKQQEKIQLDRIAKIKNNLFPNNNLQEREIAFIYFMNKYGPDIWKKVEETINEERPDNHKLIYL